MKKLEMGDSIHGRIAEIYKVLRSSGETEHYLTEGEAYKAAEGNEYLMRRVIGILTEGGEFYTFQSLVNRTDLYKSALGNAEKR
jgi:hypothetical protein